jgi:uncharacterized protein YndB with AHSA1/START domain
MPAAENNIPAAAGYELKITRVFDAPRELVWKAWTDPEMAKQWSGPRGFAATDVEMGGAIGAPWHIVLEGTVPRTGQPAKLKQGGRLLEMRPPELLSYTFAWEPRCAVGLPDSPFKENVVTVRLEAQGNKTIMHFSQTPFAAEGERDGHNSGWNSAFDRFAEFLAAQQPGRVEDPAEVPSELHLRRFFRAPRELVFQAWTNPDMVREWWGPRGFTAPVCELDARAGGELKIHMRGPDGTVYPMTGRFIEVYPPIRFHFTSTPLDAQGNPLFEIWNSVFFEEKDGGTEVLLDVHVRHAKPGTDQSLKGMRQGWSETLDRLGEFLQPHNNAN